MGAHRIETTVQPHGRVVLENLSFEESKKVEIIILKANNNKAADPNNPSHCEDPPINMMTRLTPSLRWKIRNP